MDEGPNARRDEDVEMVPVGRPNHFGLHDHDGDVRVWLRDNNDEYHDGVVNINGLPRPTIAGFGKLPFSGFLEKIITRYGIEPILAYFRIIYDLTKAKEKGVAHTVKSAIMLPLTIGSSILGGFLPTWIAPNLGTSLQDMVSSVLPFLPTSACHGFGVFISVLVTTTWGYKLSDKILTYIFNHILDTPDTVLHFTEGELSNLVNANQNLTDGFANKLNNAIDYLKGEFSKLDNKYQDFTHTGLHRNIRRAAEKLRIGNFSTLIKFATGRRDSKMVSLQYDPDNHDDTNDRQRAIEMLFSDQVRQDFDFKLRGPNNV